MEGMHNMRKQGILLLFLSVLLSGCEQKLPAQSPTQALSTIHTEMEETNLQMHVTVNGKNFTASMENNPAVQALWDMLPVTLNLSDYAGWEKVGPLGCDLPASDVSMNTVPGDIVLFNGDQIVVFYGHNSWRYTKLGHIDDLDGWEAVLGAGDVSITFSKD